MDAAAEYAVAKAAVEEATARLKLATAALAEQMAASQTKTFTHRDGGKIRRFTYVQNTTSVLDEEGLKKALGAPVFSTLTVAKLDKKKLEAAMDRGTVDPVIVGQYVTEKASAPFIRFTESEAEDE